MNSIPASEGSSLEESRERPQIQLSLTNPTPVTTFQRTPGHSFSTNCTNATFFLEDHAQEPEHPLNEIVEQDTEQSEESENWKPKRVYYLDWMRIMAIYLVVSYHVVQALDWVGLWCGYAQLQDISFRCMALQIGMPLFFYISGRAQALSRPVRFRLIVKQRSIRLLLPFVVCFALLIPQWHWINQKDWMLACEVDEGYKNKPVTDVPPFAYHTWWKRKSSIPGLGEYLIGFWSGKFFTMDPAWLWFLPILYLVTVLSTPLILYGEYRQRRYLIGVVFVWIVQACLTRLFDGLSKKPPAYFLSFGFFLGLAPLGTAAVVRIVPFPERVSTERDFLRLKDTRLRRFLAIRIITALHVATTCGLVVSFSYQAIDNQTGFSSSPLRAIPQMFCYAFFYTQGYFSARYWPDGDGSKMLYNDEPTVVEAEEAQRVKYEAPIKIYRLSCVFVVFLTIFVGSPVGEWEFSAWPVYSASFRNGWDMYPIGFALATWAWLGICSALFQAHANHEIHPWFHKHASRSTVVIYIFHWVFMKWFAFSVVRDQGLTKGGVGTFTKIIAAASTFLFSAGCSIGVYVILLKVPTLGKLFGI